jgi:hypothetical protein
LRVAPSRLDGTDPEWPAGDVELLADYRRWSRSELCPLCGMPKSVCQDKQMEGRLTVAQNRCHVTTATREARERWRQAKGRTPEGVVWSPVLRQTPLEGDGNG